MISCPPEQDLLLLVDGELGAARADEVVTHLAECNDCRVLLGNAEAALRFATGGLADSGRWAQTPRRRPIRWVAAAALVAAAGTLWGLSGSSTDEPPRVASSPETVPRAAPPPELLDLVARVERLRARLDEPEAAGRELLATGALAAADVRGVTAGASARVARLHDVMERFAGTAAAREARALVAAVEDGR